MLHDHSSVVSVTCVSHSLTGPSSTCSRTGATSLLIKLQVRHRTAERLHGHTFFPVYLFVHFVYYSVIYLLTYLPCTYVKLSGTPAERAQQYIELSQGERLSLCCDSMTNADMLRTRNSVQSHVSAISLILSACAADTFRAHRIREIADT